MALFLSLTEKNYLFYRQAQKFQSSLRVPQCYHLCKFTTRCQPEYQAYICFRLDNKLETLKIAGLSQRESPIKNITTAGWTPLLLELLELSIPLPTRREGRGGRPQCGPRSPKPLQDFLQFCAWRPSLGSYGHSC